VTSHELEAFFSHRGRIPPVAPGISPWIFTREMDGFAGSLGECVLILLQQTWRVQAQAWNMCVHCICYSCQCYSHTHTHTSLTLQSLQCVRTLTPRSSRWTCIFCCLFPLLKPCCDIQIALNTLGYFTHCSSRCTLDFVFPYGW